MPRLGEGALAQKQLDDDDDDDMDQGMSMIPNQESAIKGQKDNFRGFEEVNDADVSKIAHATPGNPPNVVPVKKNLRRFVIPAKNNNLDYFGADKKNRETALPGTYLLIGSQLQCITSADREDYYQSLVNKPDSSIFLKTEWEYYMLLEDLDLPDDDETFLQHDMDNFLGTQAKEKIVKDQKRASKLAQKSQKEAKLKKIQLETKKEPADTKGLNLGQKMAEKKKQEDPKDDTEFNDAGPDDY
jgi:hypothetical protein